LTAGAHSIGPGPLVGGGAAIPYAITVGMAMRVAVASATLAPSRSLWMVALA